MLVDKMLVDSGFREMYGDKNYCLKELQEVSKALNYGVISVDEMDGIEKALWIMSIFCPPEMKEDVHHFIDKVTQEKIMFLALNKDYKSIRKQME